MKKYDIHPDFALLSHFSPPTSPVVLPLCNAFLSLPMVHSDREVVITKGKLPGYGGALIPYQYFEPVGLKRPSPCLVYFHGGGFAIKAGPYHYQLARIYAKEAGCKVLFVDYRLAPKYPFPTPVEDCYASFRWAVKNADNLGIDPHRTAVGGDSAGGNLAAACCLMARDRGVVLPCFQMLIYPATDRRMVTASMAEFEDTPMWNARKNRAMWPLYLPDSTVAPVEYASPMEAPTLAGLPDAYVETAEFDCLRDEGIAYARALELAGSKIELNETKGTVHGFDNLLGSSVVKACVARRVLVLKAAFSC